MQIILFGPFGLLASGNFKNRILLNRAVTLQRIVPTYVPTYEKFRKNVGVRCIRWGHVFHKLRTRYHTLAYAGERCHTSNLSENFVHAQNFQRMPTY